MAANNRSNENMENHANVSGSSLCHAATANQILLSTAVVYIVDVRGTLQEARVLLDSGSQKNFMSERLALLLGLERKVVNVPIVGINQAKINAKFQVCAYMWLVHMQHNWISWLYQR